MRRWGRWPWVLLFLTLSMLPAPSAAPKRILILESFGPAFAPHDAFLGNFRTELARLSPEPVDIFEVSLESARFRGDLAERPLVDYLRALFTGRPPDLVVPVGGPATRFAQKYRQELFPATSMLFAAVEQRILQSPGLTRNDAVVSVALDLGLVMRNMLELLPDTTNVVMVIGSSPLEEYWLGETRRELQAFTNRVGFTWFNELSFAQMQKQSAALPPHSAIYYVLLSVDAEGVPYVEERALTELHAVANAPIFGIHGSQLGRGIVGGPLLSVPELSHDSAEAAVRILQGEAPENIRPPPMPLGTPRYDWRELKRWKIPETRLPSGSVIEFREPTFWEHYRGRLIGILALVLAEAVLIVLLILNLVKRRRTEKLLRESESRFRTVADSAPVLIWMSGVDTLRTFFNKAWLDFTGRTAQQEMGNGWTEGVHPEDLPGCLKTYQEASTPERRSRCSTGCADTMASLVGSWTTACHGTMRMEILPATSAPVWTSPSASERRQKHTNSARNWPTSPASSPSANSRPRSRTNSTSRWRRSSAMPRPDCVSWPREIPT